MKPYKLKKKRVRLKFQKQTKAYQTMLKNKKCKDFKSKSYNL